ncbi:MAG: glycerophosphotransferase [Ruminococcaceae bacterium]|nr:glycerophosphotransferase [Oscillospiraceae bacterium]
MGLAKKLFTAGCWVLSLALPVNKRKVVFSSYYGRGYSDNPKAIAQALLETRRNLKLVWLVKDEKEAATLPKGITPCPFGSVRSIFALATARVWVDNCRKYARFKKRDQFFLQTWHGFPLKRIEKDALEHLAPDFERGAIKDSRFTDLLVSNSSFMTRVLRRCFWYEGEIGEFGSPRNDVFLWTRRAGPEKVRPHFDLPQDRKLVLYAPTFRADHSTDAYRLEAESLLKSCAQRFGGEWSLLVRLHPNVAARSEALFPYDGRRIIDATMYPDMQELMQESDMLLTDYSSCMFDFALSGKPCLRFALDVEAYKDDRGFYFTSEEIPFPLAQSNAELCNAITHFDLESYLSNWHGFTCAQGFREDGHASKRCARWILDRLG